MEDLFLLDLLKAGLPLLISFGRISSLHLAQ